MKNMMEFFVQEEQVLFEAAAVAEFVDAHENESSESER